MDCLFGKEADVAAADIDGNVGEDGRKDATDRADTEERALLPILIILEVELLEISEQTDDCQGHAHDAQQVGPDHNEDTGHREVFSKLNPQ